MKKRLSLGMVTGEKVYYDTDFLFYIPPKIGDNVVIEHDHQGKPNLKKEFRIIGGNWVDFYNRWGLYRMISRNATDADQRYIRFITGLVK